MLELRTVYLVVKHFLPYLIGKLVLVHTGSTSAVFHINHQGGGIPGLSEGGTGALGMGVLLTGLLERGALARQDDFCVGQPATPVAAPWGMVTASPGSAGGTTDMETIWGGSGGSVCL